MRERIAFAGLSPGLSPGLPALGVCTSERHGIENSTPEWNRAGGCYEHDA